MRVPFIIPDGGGFVKLDAGRIFRYHGPDNEVMTMQYLCAPMEGVTGDLFRQAQRQTFPAADSYYTPFLSPTANRTFSPRELREIDPRLTLIAAGGINPENAAAYAATGVDGLATTAPFSAKPCDMSVRMHAL